MSSRLTAPNAPPGERTLRISARQLAEAAYRALRAAGLPSGVAADAARDALELERAHGRGLEALDHVLALDSPELAAACRAEAESGRRGELSARRAPALLLATPLIALVCEPGRSPLTVRGLGRPAALEPGLRRAAQALRLRLELITVDGTSLLQVEPGIAVAGPVPSAAWHATLDVRLSVSRLRTSRLPATPARPSDRGLLVEAETWHRLSARAARFLV